MAGDLVPGGLAELLISDWHYIYCARLVLAEKIISIVAYFRAQMVNFIFAGRYSGQSEIRRDTSIS